MLLGTSSLTSELASCGGSEMWVWYFVMGVYVIYLLRSSVLPSLDWLCTCSTEFWWKQYIRGSRKRRIFGILGSRGDILLETWERKQCVKPHGYRFLSLTSEDDNADFHSSLQMAMSQVIQLTLASCWHVCAEDAPLLSATVKNNYLSYSEKESLRYFKIVLNLTCTTAKKHRWDLCSK